MLLPVKNRRRLLALLDQNRSLADLKLLPGLWFEKYASGPIGNLV
jgi:hypothetical protein